MLKLSRGLILFVLVLAKSSDPSAQPARQEYGDAANFDEAVGMAIGAEMSAEIVRDRCMTLFPALRSDLERSYLVFRVDFARLLAVAQVAADPRFPEELGKLRESTKATIEQLMSDASDRSKAMCVGFANQWLTADQTFRERSPNAATFLDEYESAHPFDQWSDWKLGFMGGCAKQGLNRGTSPSDIVSFCECSWERIRGGMTDQEYASFGRAVEEARMSESPEARKLAMLTVDCALAVSDRELENPTTPLGAVRARRGRVDREENSPVPAENDGGK